MQASPFPSHTPSLLACRASTSTRSCSAPSSWPRMLWSPLSNPCPLCQSLAQGHPRRSSGGRDMCHVIHMYRSYGTSECKLSFDESTCTRTHAHAHAHAHAHRAPLTCTHAHTHTCTRIIMTCFYAQMNMLLGNALATVSNGPKQIVAKVSSDQLYNLLGKKDVYKRLRYGSCLRPREVCVWIFVFRSNNYLISESIVNAVSVVVSQ